MICRYRIIQAFVKSNHSRLEVSRATTLRNLVSEMQLTEKPINKNSISDWLLANIFQKSCIWLAKSPAFGWRLRIFFYFTIFQPLDFQLLYKTFFLFGVHDVCSDFKSSFTSLHLKYSCKWWILLAEDLVHCDVTPTHKIFPGISAFHFLNFPFICNFFHCLIIFPRT